MQAVHTIQVSVFGWRPSKEEEESEEEEPTDKRPRIEMETQFSIKLNSGLEITQNLLRKFWQKQMTHLVFADTVSS